MASDGPAEDRAGRDLVLLVADGTMEATCRGLLSRPEALGIRRVTFTIVPHPERDPGVFLRGPELLRSFRGRCRRALAMFDHEGSGREDRAPEDLEEDLVSRLALDWGEERCAAIVLVPELEIWWWSDSPHVAEVLGWGGRDQALRTRMVEEGYLNRGETKPDRPKEAVEKALWIAREPQSSALYRELAEQVSLRRCEDPAFARFCEILRSWFPLTG